MGTIKLDRSGVASISHAHPRRLPYLDGWRGISITLVLVAHFVGDYGLYLGSLGVEMFFVLSGRLMADILFEENFPLLEFFRRRISRVAPALLVLVGVSSFLFWRDPVFNVHAAPTAGVLTLTYNYLGALGHRSRPFDHIWSLCVEEHSYILLAVLAVAVRRGILAARPTLLIGALLSMADGVISSAVLHQTWFAAYWRTDTHIASILLPGWLVLSLHRFEACIPPWLTPAALAVGAIAFSTAAPMAISYTIGTAALAVAIASIDKSYSQFRNALSLPGLTMIGTLSYSIYLWQQMFFQSAISRWFLPPVERALLMVPVFICGLASYYLVERPARIWINHLSISSILCRFGLGKPKEGERLGRPH